MKVTIVGAGNVGATCADVISYRGIASEVVILDIKEGFAEGKAMDLMQCATNTGFNTMITGVTNDYAKTANSDVVVITSGIPRKPGMSRDDLLLTNAKIMQAVLEDIKKYAPNSKIIIVSNPLDAMVYAALKILKFPREQVIGMAGILDSARMSHFISEKLGYGAGQIESSVMGGHGDDMVPLVNYSTVAGVSLPELLSKEDIEDIVTKTKNGGLQIVKLLETGSAYYAPAHATSLMVEAILHNNKKIYPCSVMLDGEYDCKNVVSGVPVMLGANGVEKIIELKLNEEQKELFANSVASVQELIDTLDEKFFI